MLATIALVCELVMGALWRAETFYNMIEQSLEEYR
jgi:hypothetical protein